ncbi:MAG: UbiA prenyltransferase family protein [Defluviitaleaceae bacterium]|nr:UbiA prenyltransferase family protein [Defluviitaleaceae bacterium]MCL2262656.1 UbiA prenyltransferase family protein [Defluviitaleaceae bacterium]
MKKFVKLMRPKHYLKNGLVFVPIMYSFNLTDLNLFFGVAMCFAALCLVASGIYAVNDIADCEKDRAHPVNKTRPIAAGDISKGAAAVFSLVLFVAGFILTAVFGGAYALWFVGAYFLLNLAYSFRLKHHAVIDCFCVAAGFVLRVFIGGAAIDLYISEWMFLTIAAGSLFMAFGKRRGELIQTRGTESARKVIDGYSLDFLNGAVFSCAAVSMIFYALWAMTSVPLMVYTVPLIIFIICKYLLNAHAPNSYGDPITVIFADKVLLGAIALFGGLSIVFLYVV